MFYLREMHKYLLKSNFSSLFLTLLLLMFSVIHFSSFAFQNKDSVDYSVVNNKAKEFIDLFLKGENKEAYGYFNDEIKSLMDLQTFGQVKDQLQKQYGEFVNKEGMGNSFSDSLKIVEVVLKYQRALLNARLVFNDSSKIAGFFFIPTFPRANTEGVVYISADRFTEYEFTFGSKNWEVQGSVDVPKYKKSLYCVVMLSGSGPNNRNSEIGPNAPFMDIAQGLATNGIMSFRFDKRTKTYNKKMIADTTLNITLNEEYYEDADNAIDFVYKYADSTKINIKGIILLGHSQGGSVVPYLLNYSKNKDKIIGGILMAPPARPLEDLVVEQLTYIAELDNVIDDKEKKEIEKAQDVATKVKNINELEKFKNVRNSTELPLGLPYEYWISLKENKFLENLKDEKQALFVLFGGKDYQVTAKDLSIVESVLADKLNQKDSKYKIKFYDNLNHLFMKHDGIPTPEMYNQKNNVNEEVILDIVKWIKTAFRE